MQALIALGGLVIAALAQKLNSNPRIPTVVVKGTLALVGILMYAVADPPDAMTRAALLEWLDKAWLWALALPGAASLVALAPGMATNSGAAAPGTGEG